MNHCVNPPTHVPTIKDVAPVALWPVVLWSSPAWLRPAHNIIIYLIKYVCKRELGTHRRQLLKHNAYLLILYEDRMVSVTTRRYSDLSDNAQYRFFICCAAKYSCLAGTITFTDLNIIIQRPAALASILWFNCSLNFCSLSKKYLKYK